MSTLEDIIKSYQEDIANYQEELAKKKREIYQVGTLRLICFIVGVFCFFYFIHQLLLATILLVIALLPFFWLIKVHSRLFARKDYLESGLTVCEQELKAIHYDSSSFDDGSDYIDTSHSYTYDIDVFGEKSLFQSLNRTVTSFGRVLLAKEMNRPSDDKIAIEKRQKTIQELSQQRAFRQEFRIQGLLYKGSAEDGTEIEKWSKTENHFASRRYYQWIKWAVPAINAICIILAILNIVSYTLPCFTVLLFILLSVALSQQISKVQSSSEEKLHILSTYSRLLILIEKGTFESEELVGIQQAIQDNHSEASEIIHKLSRMLNALDQRNNILVTALLNGLFFWELHTIMRIEKWKQRYGSHLSGWLQQIGRMDALCSLGTFVYNNPSFVYPSISDAPIYKARALKHPLMNRETCVPNDIDMIGAPRFAIITGANMAGKSTYLRTIAINHLLACLGLPVDAEEMSVYPAHLVTSLRANDSLKDNESYFFAEVKRLKMIVDKLQDGEQLFIILDEILRGTNSVDKQKGSYSFIKQIIQLGASGLIATHDLQLAHLKDAFPQIIETYCFEADIRNDELTFSYKLQEGVAQNMNACFLMKKMGIHIED